MSLLLSLFLLPLVSLSLVLLSVCNDPYTLHLTASNKNKLKKYVSLNGLCFGFHCYSTMYKTYIFIARLSIHWT